MIEVSRSATGLPISIPVTIVNGEQDGPVLVCNAAMHGTETIGTVVLSKFFRTLRPDEIRGAFIGVPILGMWSVEADHRLPTVFDHFDIEQLFPGDPVGSITERIASTFIREVASKADCVIDFHGQDQYWQPTSAIIVPRPESDSAIGQNIYSECVRLAKIFGVDQIWRLSKPGNLTEAIMRQKGIPAISTEFGGVTDFKRQNQYVDEAITGIRNVMRAMGMLRAGSTTGDAAEGRKTAVCDLRVVLSSRGGVWWTERRVGEMVDKGDILGTITDPLSGDTVEEIRATESGVLSLVWCSPIIRPTVVAAGVGKVAEII
jgi:predicted deacylase